MNELLKYNGLPSIQLPPGFIASEQQQFGEGHAKAQSANQAPAPSSMDTTPSPGELVIQEEEPTASGESQSQQSTSGESQPLNSASALPTTSANTTTTTTSNMNTTDNRRHLLVSPPHPSPPHKKHQ